LADFAFFFDSVLVVVIFPPYFFVYCRGVLWIWQYVCLRNLFWEGQGSLRAVKTPGNAGYGAPCSVSRTVGHLKVPLLIIENSGFFGALSV